MASHADHFSAILLKAPAGPSDFSWKDLLFLP